MSGPIPLHSHGTNALLKFGAGGARAQAAAGFPHAIEVGLPALRLGRRLAPKDPEAARVQGFFAILASMEDTNLLHRGGAVGLRYAQEAAIRFLEQGGVEQADWRERAVAVHRAFVVRRLSPGGCADLLAVTLFLDALEAHSMSVTAVLCSGQGYQGAGMFDLLADAPEAIPVFKAAEFVLEGKDPRQLVRKSGNDELHADKVGQILCCTQAMAAWAVLSAKVPRPLVVAGYSVGELAAWGVAGLLDYEEVLHLAIQRAAAMDKSTTATVRASGHPRSYARQVGSDLQGAWSLCRDRQR